MTANEIHDALTAAAERMIAELRTIGFNVPEYDFPSTHSVRLKAMRGAWKFEGGHANCFQANVWLRSPGDEGWDDEAHRDIYCSLIATRDLAVQTTRDRLADYAEILAAPEAVPNVQQAYKAALNVRRATKHAKAKVIAA